MRIRSLVFPVLCALVFALALPAFAQEADSLATVTPTTGKLVFTFHVTVSSVVPKNAVVACKASAIVGNDANGVTQSGDGVATISGGKATCTVTMPYSWTLATPTKDVISLGYEVDLDYGYEVTATNGTATLVVPTVANSTRQNLAPISVPLNGSTTNESVNATI